MCTRRRLAACRTSLLLQGGSNCHLRWWGVVRPVWCYVLTSCKRPLNAASPSSLGCLNFFSGIINLRLNCSRAVRLRSSWTIGLHSDSLLGRLFRFKGCFHFLKMLFTFAHEFESTNTSVSFANLCNLFWIKTF